MKVGRIIALVATVCWLVGGSVAWADPFASITLYDVAENILTQGTSVATTTSVNESIFYRVFGSDGPCALGDVTLYVTRPGEPEAFQYSLPLGGSNCEHVISGMNTQLVTPGTHTYRYEYTAVRCCVRETDPYLIAANAILTVTVKPVATATPPVITNQRVYLWDNYVNDPYTNENIKLRGEGLDSTVNVPLGESLGSLFWTTFSVADIDCDISIVRQWLDSAPPGLFPEGILPAPIVDVSGWIADDPRYNCGGDEQMIGGLPYIWLGTAGNLFLYAPGQYNLRTEITDVAGNITNARFTINIVNDLNHPPVAAIGEIGQVVPGSPLVLNGTPSFDPDPYDSIVSYDWIIEPLGLTATGALTSVVIPTPGVYTVRLIVTDTFGATGEMAVPVSTFNNPPSVDAGNDYSLTQGDPLWVPCFKVTPCATPEEAENRNSDPDGDTLMFEWFLFDPDLGWISYGTPALVPVTQVDTLTHSEVLRLRLRAIDSFGAINEDEIVVSLHGNLAPIADAGQDWSALEGTMFRLDGSLSYDPEGAPLTYQWSLISGPSGTFSSTNDPWSVFFIPTVAGTYVVGLVVNDGVFNSPVDTATIVITGRDETTISMIQNAISYVGSLSNTDFRRKTQRASILSMLNASVLQMEAARYPAAFDLLAQVFARGDGCLSSGTPDADDWVMSCEHQTLISFEVRKNAMSFLAWSRLGWNLGGQSDLALIISPVNPKRDTKLTVAVLSTPEVYTPAIDVRLGATFTVVSTVRSTTATVKDVNGDGISDLVFEYPVAGTGIVCGSPTTGHFFGLSVSGWDARGTAEVPLKGCK